MKGKSRIYKQKFKFNFAMLYMDCCSVAFKILIFLTLQKKNLGYNFITNAALQA